MAKNNLMGSMNEVTKAQLVAEFKTVIADAEALIKATDNQGGEKVEQLRTQAESSLAAAKVKIDDLHEDLVEKGREAVKATDAGGSIGSELCRQLIRFQPGLLICFDISEYALYQLEQ